MRGGAIPVLAWGSLLVVLMVINAIWTTDPIQIEMFAFAIAVIWSAALGLWISHRQAIRKGPPSVRTGPEAVPASSLSAFGVGISIGAMLFGAVFGKFLVFIGGGVLALSLGRLLFEVRAQRKSLRAERERW